MKIVHFNSVPNQVLNKYFEIIDSSEKLYSGNNHILLVSDRVLSNFSAIKFKNIDINLMKLIENRSFELKKILTMFYSSIITVKIIKNADKVIFHSLPPIQVQLLMLIFPFIKTKIHWAIFGGDLYQYLERDHSIGNVIKELIRRRFIENIDFIHTNMEYENLKLWYKTNASLCKGTYPLLLDYQFLDKQLKLKREEQSRIRIMVGNSACPTNNHIEVFKRISEYKIENLEVIVPLSYSITDRGYLDNVIKQGRMLLGGSFKPIFEYQPPEQYIQNLNKVDVVIMNHDRQRALGILLPLLYLQKKIYIRYNTPIDNYLRNKLGCNIYDTRIFFQSSLHDLLKWDTEVERNKDIIKKKVSIKRFIEEWKDVFGN